MGSLGLSDIFRQTFFYHKKYIHNFGQIVERQKDGNDIEEQKIKEDLQMFGNMVMSISMKYLKNQADAENITQEAFLNFS